MVPSTLFSWPLIAFGTAVDTMVTLTERSRIIADAAMHPHRPLDPELTSMVTEKFVAASEGAFAAQRAMINLAFAASRGTRPDVMARGAVAVYEAAVRPSRRKVRANAKRLTRKD